MGYGFADPVVRAREAVAGKQSLGNSRWETVLVACIQRQNPVGDHGSSHRVRQVASQRKYPQVHTGAIAAAVWSVAARTVHVKISPGALTAALNWYRAVMAADTPPPSGAMAVEIPTLFVWGNQDEAVGRYGVEQQAKYMKGPYKLLELNAGHWLLRDQPEKTLTAIIDHIENYSK